MSARYALPGFDAWLNSGNPSEQDEPPEPPQYYINDVIKWIESRPSAFVMSAREHDDLLDLAYQNYDPPESDEGDY